MGWRDGNVTLAGEHSIVLNSQNEVQRNSIDPVAVNHLSFMLVDFLLSRTTTAMLISDMSHLSPSHSVTQQK